MDLFDNVKKVNVEPIQVIARDELINIGAAYILNQRTSYIFKFPVPDDGYQYLLYSYYLHIYRYTGTEGIPGAFDFAGGFALDQDNPDWVWVCERWCYMKAEMIPTKQGSLSLTYPGAYGIYIWNNSSKSVAAHVLFLLRKKPVEA